MELTNQQQEVINFKNHCFVMASAGAGKTHTVAEKIKVIKQAEPDSRILYITFTRRAKKHAIDKIGDVYNVLVTNFHSLAYMILNTHKSELKISEVDIVNDSYCLAILRDLYPDDDNPQVRKKLGLINNLKVECIPIEEMALEYKSIFIQFQQILDARRKFTYSDLLVKFKKLMDENMLKDHYAKKVLKFDYIMCDETNDNNKIQFKILDSLFAINPELKFTCVADVSQTVYTWRNARPDLCIEYINKYEMKVLPLTKNFRSQESIIDLGNKSLDLLTKFPELKFKMNYHKPRGSNISVRQFYDAKDQYRDVCGKLHDYLSMGYKPSDINVLFRKNQSGNMFERQALKFSLPFRLMKGNFLERKIVRYLINMIKLSYSVVVDESEENIDSYLSPICYEIAADVGVKSYKLVKKAVSPFNLIDKFKNIDFINIPGIGPAKRQAFKKFYDTIMELVNIYKESKDDIAMLIDRYSKIALEFKYFLNIENYQFRAVKEDIVEFKDLLRDIEGTIIERINVLLTDFTTSDDKSDNDKILGMTVHQAKGTEAPVIFIIDLHDFPLHFTIDTDSEEEEKRCLYVAITRAMDHLNLSYTGEFYYNQRLFENFEYIDTNTSQVENFG